MKLIIEQNDETFTIEVKYEDSTTSEILEYMYQLMLGAGYHKRNIDEAFYNKADDLGAEEGLSMQPIETTKTINDISTTTNSSELFI